MKAILVLALVGAAASTRTPWSMPCVVTCNTVGTAACVNSNGTNFGPGTYALANGQTVSCATNPVSVSADTATSYTCQNDGGITINCLGQGASLSDFNSEAAILNFLNTFHVPYISPGNDCNADCDNTAQCTNSLFQCSQCFFNCTSIREQRLHPASRFVACTGLGLSVAQQTSCFRAAACNGLIVPTSTCFYNNSGVLSTSTCPTCSASKKGLLGLLGLLGLIPCLLCLSLSCLLLLCFIRRKKTAAAVPFATFDPIVAPVTCAPVATACAPVMECAPVPMIDPCAQVCAPMPCGPTYPVVC